MTTHTHAEAPTVHTRSPDRMARLPLRAELFLLAHDDDTGEPHLNEQSLAVGLAGAILLELWASRHVAIGWDANPRTQQWQQRPGAITITQDRLTGDPLTDAAIATIRHTHHRGDHTHLRTWLRAFAGSDLYERVRANMITVGVLQRSSRRRALGLVKTDAYLATHDSWAVRARAAIRSVMSGREPPDTQCTALCGLVDVLELAPYLYHPSLSNHDVHQMLRGIVHHHTQQHRDPTIRDIIAAVDAGRGDLAVAAMK
jgi:hypothetical protein